MNRFLREISIVSLLGVLLLVIAPGGASATPYTFMTISVPGAVSTTASGINNSGAIVGSYSTNGNNTIGFLDQNNSFTTISIPGAVFTTASGINNSGAIVGTGGTNGFLYQNNTFTTISVPGGNSTTEVLGINNLGAVVGRVFSFVGSTPSPNGFLDQHNVFTQLEMMLSATGINDSGTIVGYTQGVSGGVSGVLDQNNVFTLFNMPGEMVTVPHGINNSNAIVGSYSQNGFGSSGGSAGGFLDIGGVFSTINDPLASLGGTIPFGINNSGQIVGEYVNASGTYGFLATPNALTSTPEPGTVILFGSGLLLMGLLTLRKCKTSSAV